MTDYEKIRRSIIPAGQDLANELNDLCRMLAAAVEEHGRYGRDLAMKEQAYRIKRMEETLKLRAEGTPVTIVDTIAKGRCAKEGFEKDTAEVLFKTAQENINSLKLKIRVVSAQIDREWGGRHE